MPILAGQQTRNPFYSKSDNKGFPIADGYSSSSTGYTLFGVHALAPTLLIVRILYTILSPVYKLYGCLRSSSISIRHEFLPERPHASFVKKFPFEDPIAMSNLLIISWLCQARRILHAVRSSVLSTIFGG